MGSLNITWIIGTAIFVIWAILVWIFAGEKYMKWYYRDLSIAKRYDRRKFKIVHVCFLFFAAGCFLWMGLSDIDHGWIPLCIFIASSFIQHTVIHTACKKKPDSKQK